MKDNDTSFLLAPAPKESRAVNWFLTGTYVSIQCWFGVDVGSTVCCIAMMEQIFNVPK